MITPDSPYFSQVRLLVAVLPIVAKERCFALKGGTAINLFVRDMPRLSVDIDLAFVPISDRTTALTEIDAALGRITKALATRPFDFNVRIGKRQDGVAYGLLVSNGAAEIKIEVSPVLRGLVYGEQMRRIVAHAEAAFGFAEVPVVSFDDLYAGKMVAALDRQHPRDLYDVKLLLANEGIGDTLFRTFLVYLISHDGSMARVLDPTLKPLPDLFAKQFVGMTVDTVMIDELVQARTDLIAVLHARLGDRERAFLMSFKRGEPDWELLGIAHVRDLPAVRWKLQNLAKMESAKLHAAIRNLERVFETIGRI